eukprot:347544-Alexandrium_andersonii.AAC.1
MFQVFTPPGPLPHPAAGGGTFGKASAADQGMVPAEASIFRHFRGPGGRQYSAPRLPERP